jgi:hypothetical protein
MLLLLLLVMLTWTSQVQHMASVMCASLLHS